MKIALAVLATLAFAAVDARAWVLMHDADMEGLWVFYHCCGFGIAAAAAWTVVSESVRRSR